MVDGVYVRVNHGGGLSISARHNDERRVEHIGLQTASDEALDVLPSGHQDLAAHVAALFGARLLVLDVDSRGTVLHKHLGELHRRCKSSVAGVRIRDDGVEVVHNGSLGALLGRHAAALFVLLPIVEELRLEELINLVRHRVVGVVCHIGAGLVGCGSSGARLPAAHIDRGEVLRHLHDLHGVERAEGMRAGALGLVIAHHGVELL
mmetsp:Transcript_39633/g.89088  ORF Transcript_39633/g.89088 Transcript_39633/m.89088 type:complete len:206 (+) Transcript_39633:1106-1723(+)